MIYLSFCFVPTPIHFNEKSAINILQNISLLTEFYLCENTVLINKALHYFFDSNDSITVLCDMQKGKENPGTPGKINP